jgi:hypothetical protein
MLFETKILKMRTEITDEVQYYLKGEEEDLHLNEFIGSPFRISFQNEIRCVVCDRQTKKAFGQGFCYPCFMDAPENSPCIIKPELCEAHLGKGRDVEWEQRNHMQPHFVYLAKSSAIKVGITRDTQIPTRWIDQGATEAIIIAKVPYRKLCGDIEVALKEHYTDKTSWQRMLKNEVSDESLLEHHKNVVTLFPEELKEYYQPDEKVLKLDFPVDEFPVKVKSMKLDKLPEIEGTLMGIKGQYLLFDEGRVINLRSHSGYVAKFEA